MSTEETQPTFAAPGAGRWDVDRSHFAGGATPILQDLMEPAMTDGMRRVMTDLGSPAETLSCRFVNGFMYTRLRPLINADKRAKKLPPNIVLKVATRLHPEMRRRARTAAAVIAERPWRKVTHDWEHGGRSVIEQQNLGFQDVDLSSLDDAALLAHVAAVRTHCRATLEHHFWLHGYDLGPIAMYLSDCRDWGIAPRPALSLLEGASPSTSEPVRLLAAIRAALVSAGSSATTLAQMRATSPAIAALIDGYMRQRTALLFSRYDLDGVTLGEVPDVVAQSVLSAEVKAPVDLTDKIAALRATVPVDDHARFDERLTEARAAMNLRDDNGPTTAEWPLGLLRLALLEVGRRRVERGTLQRAAHIVELQPAELGDAFDRPTGDVLAERAAARQRCAALVAPDALGDPELAPPLEVLPGPLRQIVSAVQIALEQMGMAGERTSGLSGTGIGETVYRGTARRADSPEEALDSMEPGDVLVVPCTTPAYNVVLAIAGAVVTAAGGPLSHAAVLARELGIPAVIGAVSCLSEIPDGAEVEVDPVAGVVRVLAIR